MTTDPSDPYLTAGRLRALTGLSPKALRLYADRGLLAPAAVDPVTGYRAYAREQLRDGVVLDLLRRAHVPLAELGAVAGRPALDLEGWRSRLAVRRAAEDLHLALAERVAGGDPSVLVPTARTVAPTAWVGVAVDLPMPDEADEALDVFTGLAVDLPTAERTLLDALAEAGVETEDECWSAAHGTEARPRLLVAHRLPAPLGADVVRRLSAAVDGRAGAAVTAGTLPARDEVTFSRPRQETRPGTTDDDPVGELAEEYLRLLAFARYTAGRAVRALHPLPRRHVAAGSLLAATPSDVFDAVPS